MPLHTDYRPEALTDIVGNETAVKQIESHLTKENPNRSLLFHGPSGCGKTTLARIVANEVGAGGSDFHELNTSDFGGIEMVREIRAKSQYRPVHGQSVVWLMDECHRLSAAAQEAILKLLEDPPPNVWIILATTEPSKLKVTVRRRCTEIAVESLSDEDVSKLLRKVCTAERKRIPSEVLKQIVNDALGSPGIALKVLDEIMGLDKEDMKDAGKRAVERENTVIELCRALLQSKSWKEIAKMLQNMEGEDPETVRRTVLEYFRKVLLGGDESAFVVMDCFRTPFYDTGKAGLALACYEAMEAE